VNPGWAAFPEFWKGVVMDEEQHLENFQIGIDVRDGDFKLRV